MKLEQNQHNPIPPKKKSAAFRGRQDAPANPVLFAAVLTPNRSLNRGKIRLFTTLLGFIFCLGSGVFILAGAWPISGFFCLEFLVLYLAFRACDRQGNVKETVSLGHDILTVERITADGRKTTWQFQPYWLQIGLRQETCSRGYLTLSSRGKSMQLGSFLSPTEQNSLAQALKQALRRS